MSGSREQVYLDSCIFIAHLNNEDRQDPNDRFGIDEIVNQFDLGQIEIVTSTLTITEVMRTKIPQEQLKRFRSLFSRRNFHLVDVTREIAEVSEEIRSYYYEPNKATLGTPDCIHIATAIYWPCDVLLTFDGEGNRPGILGLQNPIAGKYNLQIRKPNPTRPPQLAFNF